MVDSMQPGDKPVSILMCTGDVTSSSASGGVKFSVPNLVGYQVSYGSYGDLPNASAGPAHGDISSGCTAYQFTSPVVEVNFYTQESDGLLQGMRLLFDVPGETTRAAISGGACEQTDQLKYSTPYATADLMQFFGF